MKNGKEKKLSNDIAKLRSHAEAILDTKTTATPAPRTESDLMQLVHELEVYQIELEMQNAELRGVREQLELSSNTYAELYDFAPIGYFTFDSAGVIRNVNHAGAQLLGKERQLLIGRPFDNFIDDNSDKEIFSNHLALVMQRQVVLKCEIKLTNKNGKDLYGQLQSVVVSNSPKDANIFTSVVDGTIRRQLEMKLQDSHDRLELIVNERTQELTCKNEQLLQEIEERKKAEEALKCSYKEINHLKERLQEENIYLHHEIARENNFGEIIGQSAALSQVFSLVEQVAPINATVLLLGETGTGKGVVARAIHRSSARKSRPMITVNCTALPGNLIESELFGRERGAFTGAHARQMGRFELADGGTIFLDEIGEMPLELQCKLLRVIQDGEFERLGSPHTIKVDVRIIAASNRNLEEEIRKGTFREDLFYRLNVFPVNIPPLRQRKEDIPLLVNHFINKFNKKMSKHIKTVSKETMSSLQEYHWPGNVRELESVIERAVIISPGTSLQVLDRFDTSSKTAEPANQNIKALVELEHDHILQVLRKTGWRIEGKNGAAILLGLNSSTLRARMRKFGIFRK